MADIGVWSSETFDIQKDQNSNLVGIGMITYKRFAEFKKGVSHEQYNQTIIDIIKLLESNGVRWKMFTNGVNADYENAVEVCNSLNLKPEDCIVEPHTPYELVKIISGFKGIITARLHSCIVAYSLDIPYIALSWNNKLNYFSDSIGYPERTVTHENFSAKQIIERYIVAENEGYDESSRASYKEIDVDYFKKYLSLMQ